MKNPTFTSGEIYHIYNRGVEKREVFGDDRDRWRFLQGLFEFNDIAPAPASYHRQNFYEVQPHNRELIIEILAFCLMPNHYHLLIMQKIDGGIVRFMQKLGTGYTMYFNQKYERVGSLFQGRFKGRLIENDSHMRYIPHYIHLNPIDLIEPDWKGNNIYNQKKALEFIEKYRWSSYLDYIGQRNFPNLTSRDFILELYKNEVGYKKDLVEWLKEKEKALEEIRDVILD